MLSLNAMASDNKRTIGKAEYVWLVESGIKKVPARIDTGARTSAIWASEIEETDDGLQYVLFDECYPFYSGAKLQCKNFAKIAVANSSGHVQVRYKVPMTIQIRGRRIKTFCTLADRSAQAYPVLIGRNTLRGKFVVDVQQGSYTLSAIDRERFDALQSLIKENDS